LAATNRPVVPEKFAFGTLFHMSYDQRDAPIAQICTDRCYAGKLIYAGERRQCVADLFNEGRVTLYRALTV